MNFVKLAMAPVRWKKAITVPMKSSSNSTQEKASLPSERFSRSGKPRGPRPSTSVPMMQATAREKTVLRVRNASAMAMIAGSSDSQPGSRISPFKTPSSPPGLPRCTIHRTSATRSAIGPRRDQGGQA
jgi:hypothetical protein